MQPFLIIAAAHFLALLSPGPDFFLIARTSLFFGWRVTSGTCLGIALANGVFIGAAFTGTAAMRPDTTWFLVLQIAGCAYLLYLGVLFIRYAGNSDLTMPSTHHAIPSASQPFIAWQRAMGMGFLSGIFNPKNALFYASLAAMLTGPYASAGWKTIYGVWMFSVVFLWDILIAILIGNKIVLRRFSRALPCLERISGAMLILLALGVIVILIR